MRLEALHRTAAVVLLGLGLSVLGLSGEFSWLYVTGCFLLGVVGQTANSLLRPFTALPIASSIAIGSGILFGYLAFSTGNFLYYVVLYSMFIASFKATMLRSARDYWQFTALSFLHLVAGSVINPGLSFGILSLLYVVVLTFMLLLTTVRSQLEATAKAPQYLERQLDRRDLVRPSFLGVTAVISTVMFLASAVFFFFLPRIGLGFFAQKRRPGLAVSGFSDKVKLGEMAGVLQDQTVVLRVKPLEGELRVPLRIRGQSFDTYAHHTWTKSTKRLHRLVMDQQGRYRLHGGLGALPKDARGYQVYLEPLEGSRRVLFGPDRPIAFKPPSGVLQALRPGRWRFYQDEASDVVVTGPPEVAITYLVWSVRNTPSADDLRAATTAAPPWVERLYATRPDVDPKVTELAKRVTAGTDNQYDAVMALQTFLRTRFEYSLTSTHDPKDPVVDFLFKNRVGHCEYFASAMTLMLRSLGIPARVVTGFYGGEYNKFGDYVVLRKADAHSWVEVYFRGYGFVPFDPTPPSALQRSSGQTWIEDLSELLDSLKLWWYRWVVEYDLEKQLDFLSRVLGVRRSQATGFSAADIRQILRRIKHLPWHYLGLAIVTPLLVLLLARVLIRRRKRAWRPPADLPSVKQYRKAVNKLRRQGLVRNPSETQVEFARRVAREAPHVVPDFLEVTQAYICDVFGRDKDRVTGRRQAIPSGPVRSYNGAGRGGIRGR